MYTASNMKPIILSSLLALLVISCSESNSDADICGEWKLATIRTEVNDMPDVQSVDNVFYIFHKDSTYQVEDGDFEELGRWTLEDSILTLYPDSIDSVSVKKVIKLSEDSLIHETYTESDFGQIHEIMTLTRTK